MQHSSHDTAAYVTSNNPFYWFKRALFKYAVFKGRARRKEFWMFMLTTQLIALCFYLCDRTFGSMWILNGTYSIATLLPTAAVLTRRLHDTDQSGWWVIGFYTVSFLFLSMCIALSMEIDNAGHIPSLFQWSFISILFIAFTLQIIIVVFACQKGTTGDNRFGPNPLEP